MRRAAWLASLVVVPGILALAACRQPQGAARPSDADAARIARIEQGLLPAVEVQGESQRKPLLDRMRELKIPGLAIAVFERYELRWVKAYGFADVAGQVPITDDTRFLAGSISKSVNALAVLKAAADGTVSLDAPVNTFLSTWKLPDNDLTRATPVTLRQLLSHTAGTTVHGFPGYRAGATLPTIQQILDGAPPANTPAVRVDLAPGTRFRYSGGGTTITQLALVDRTGRAYPDILRDRVLAPLGMTRSTFVQVPPPATAAVGHDGGGNPVEGKRNAYPEMAAAGLWTTPADLARFFAEVARARAGESKLITRELAQQMTTSVIGTSPMPGGDSVGLGVFLTQRGGEKTFGHGGADVGFQADATASLDGGFGVVVMANSENGMQIFPEIMRTIWREHGWPGTDQPIVRVAADPAPFVGTYARDGRPLMITAEGTKLFARPPFGERVELVPIAPDTVVATDSAARFTLDPATRGLTFKPNGRAPVPIARVDGATRYPLVELEAGRFDEAVALWKEIARTDPKAPAVSEPEINMLGYMLIQRGRARDAVAVLRLVATANPDSANAHDSLGDAYAAAGEIQKAIDSYEASLAALDADPRIPPPMKADLRKHALEQIEKLRKAPPRPTGSP